MHHITALALASLAISQVLAYEVTLGFNSTVAVENRTLDEIYRAALAEGGTVTLWHGGDEANQMDGVKEAFESWFHGMTLNVTVDLSKYLDGNLDQQLAASNVYDDSIIEGALLHYAPKGFEQVYPTFRDPNAAWYGVEIFGWSFVWNTDKLNISLAEFADILRPELKDKLVITYPNDDDAVFYAFDLMSVDGTFPNLEHGDVYELFTADPDGRPLPYMRFLEIRYAVQKLIAGPQASGALEDIFDGEPPEGGLGPALHLWRWLAAHHGGRKT
ncbi:hypothetical protein B0T24DRAFT_677969 [Lasiosphaeria ovina]|uniref:Uncharacterized protein n=1 Tax=Lasiosphaeria ovina TaxID=92902 RepID=A0AAE0NC24_9PEZI|nr:hypothetical protein B0T24DRAFT_677969 [Lasiosphaeria ovina]